MPLWGRCASCVVGAARPSLVARNTDALENSHRRLLSRFGSKETHSRRQEDREHKVAEDIERLGCSRVVLKSVCDPRRKGGAFRFRRCALSSAVGGAAVHARRCVFSLECGEHNLATR